MRSANDEEEVRRIIRVIEANPEIRAEVQRAVLTERLLQLPDEVARLAATAADLAVTVAELRTTVADLGAKLAELTAIVSGYMQRTDERLERLESDTATLKSDTATLKTDVGGLKGMALEEKIARNPSYYLGRVVRHARIVALDDLLGSLGLGGAISEDDYDVLAVTDFFVRGAAGPAMPAGEAGSGQVLLLVEATWKAHTGDIERQVRRRDVLARYGAEAHPVIVSEAAANEQVRQMAGSSGVMMIYRGG
ncbi:MAG: hypothetical protein ACYDH5_13110 [Acidimicrobiales bacterium]